MDEEIDQWTARSEYKLARKKHTFQLIPHTHHEAAPRTAESARGRAAGDVELVLRTCSATAGATHSRKPLSGGPDAIGLTQLPPGSVPAQLARPAGGGVGERRGGTTVVREKWLDRVTTKEHCDARRAGSHAQKNLGVGGKTAGAHDWIAPPCPFRVGCCCVDRNEFIQGGTRDKGGEGASTVPRCHTVVCVAEGIVCSGLTARFAPRRLLAFLCPSAGSCRRRLSRRKQPSWPC